MIPVSASIYKKTQYHPAFKADMNTVRYVIVDGHVVDDKKVVEAVTKEFVKSIRYGNEDNKELRRSVKKVIPEYSFMEGYQETKFLKLNKLGKEFNFIIGASARKLQWIWQQFGVSLKEKKMQAGDVIKQLIYDKNSKHIAIEAVTKNVKGKIKYIAKRIFITV